MGWSTMEDAPRDGRMILGVEGDAMTVVYWRDSPRWWGGDERGYWALSETGRNADIDEWEPEKWRELPGPPV